MKILFTRKKEEQIKIELLLINYFKYILFQIDCISKQHLKFKFFLRLFIFKVISHYTYTLYICRTI